MAPKGFAVELSIFFHYINADYAEELLTKGSYTPIFYMNMLSGEIASVAFRNVPFDRTHLPNGGLSRPQKLSNIKVVDSKNLHATLISDHKNGEPLQLIEVNGFKIKD